MKINPKGMPGTLAAAKASAADPGFSTINPHDLARIMRIANRAKSLADQHRLTTDKKDNVLEINVELVAIDIAITHLRRKLRLADFEQSDVLSFMAEYVTIQKYIIRPSNFFPLDVALRFAQIGASLATH